MVLAAPRPLDCSGGVVPFQGGERHEREIRSAVSLSETEKSRKRTAGIGAGSDSQLRYHADVLVPFDQFLRLEPSTAESVLVKPKERTDNNEQWNASDRF